MMASNITAVQPLPKHQLLATFENGERRIFDLSPYLGLGVFTALKDISIFNSVHVNFDTIEWANGADLCPETVYAESIPAGQAVGVQSPSVS